VQSSRPVAIGRAKDMSVGSRAAPQRSVRGYTGRHLACSCEQLLRCLRRRRAAPSSIHCPCARTLLALPVGRRDSLPALPPDSEPALVTPHSVQRMLVPRLVKVLPRTGSRPKG
jgi:hypothetical protein